MLDLIVIDMQNQFDAANYPDVVYEVGEEIREAMERKAKIFLIEYRGYGSTHEFYLKKLNRYKYLHIIKKRKNDGSHCLCNYLKNRNITISEEIRVCGVNTLACVKETVHGLSNKFPNKKIHVVLNACGDNIINKKFWESEFSYLKKENMVLLNA